MSSRQKFSLTDRVKSLKYALRGIKVLWVEEHNARIHIAAACATIALGVVYGVSSMEWIALTMVMSLVIMAECLNSAVERLGDYCSLEQHLLIGKAKDLAAAGVLVCAVAALVVGLIIFIPKMFHL